MLQPNFRISSYDLIVQLGFLSFNSLLNVHIIISERAMYLFLFVCFLFVCDMQCHLKLGDQSSAIEWLEKAGRLSVSNHEVRHLNLNISVITKVPARHISS